MKRKARRPRKLQRPLVPNDVGIEIRPARVRTSAVVRAAILEFEALLDACAPEAAIQSFLASHLYFWNGLLRFGNDLYSKVALGAEYEIDFVFCDPSSSGAEWHLVEIEPASAKLFTRRGDPSQKLVHALTQVQDWQRWIEANRAYAEKLMPGVDHPMGHVFMGRRDELTAPRAKERMAAINHASRSHVQVRTLDAFASFAYSMLTADISHFPAMARTDSELRSGLPSSLLHYIGSPIGRSKQFIDDRLASRDFEESDEDPKDVPVFVNRSVIRSRSRRPASINDSLER